MELETITDFITKYQPIYYVVGIVIWCSFILVDNFNVTQLERKLMTPKSKFMYYFSQIFLMSIFTLASVILFSNEQSKEMYYNENDEILYSVLFAFLMMLMAFHSCIVLVVKLITNSISINFKYYYLESEGEKWNLVRMNKNKTLLVENKQMVYKFIKEPFENSYHKEIISGEGKKNLLKWINKNDGIMIFLVMLSLVVTISSTVFKESMPVWVSLLLFVIGALSILVIASFVFASLEYIKLENEIAQNNSSN